MFDEPERRAALRALAEADRDERRARFDFASFWGGFVCGITVALFAVILGGCASPVDPEPRFTEHDRQAIETTISTWSQHSLPYSPRCVSERLELRVLAVPQAQLDKCALLESGRGAIRGCYSSQHKQIWVPDDADVSLRQDVVVHETIHWLHECVWGNTDPMHTGLWPARRLMRDDVCVWETEGTRCIEMQAWVSL